MWKKTIFVQKRELSIKDKVCSLFLRAPGNIVRPCCCAVLVYQLLDNFPRVVQLIKVVLEYVLFAELLQEGLALTQFVVLPACPLKQLRDSKKEKVTSTLTSQSEKRIKRFFFRFFFRTITLSVLFLCLGVTGKKWSLLHDWNFCVTLISPCFNFVTYIHEKTKHSNITTSKGFLNHLRLSNIMKWHGYSFF